MSQIENVVVVGSGPTGYTAAMTAHGIASEPQFETAEFDALSR